MRTCRKILLVAAAVFAAAHGFCGVGATQAWVANYVSNYVAQTAQSAVAITSTNGVTTYASGGGRLVVEEATEKGLYIIEQTALSAAGGYTNGTVLARVEGQNLYRSGAREVSFDDEAYHCAHGGHTYTSRAIDGRTWLALDIAITNGPSISTNVVRFCALARTYIQPSRVAAILRGE